MINNYEENYLINFSIVFILILGHLVLCRSIGRESIKYDLDLNSVETIDSKNSTILPVPGLEQLKNVQQESDALKHWPGGHSNQTSSLPLPFNGFTNETDSSITNGHTGDDNERSTTIYHIFYSNKYSDSIIYIMVGYYTLNLPLL